VVSTELLLRRTAPGAGKCVRDLRVNIDLTVGVLITILYGPCGGNAVSSHSTTAVGCSRLVTL